MYCSTYTMVRKMATKNGTASLAMVSGLDADPKLTVDETAAYLRWSRTAVYNAMNRGDLPSFKMGRSRRIALSAIKAFQERCQEASVNYPNPVKSA